MHYPFLSEYPGRQIHSRFPYSHISHPFVITPMPLYPFVVINKIIGTVILYILFEKLYKNERKKNTQFVISNPVFITKTSAFTMFWPSVRLLSGDTFRI
jgi:hypothetical protein